MTSRLHPDAETAEFERQVEHAAAALRPSPPHRYRRILVAYNGSDHARAALDRAAAIAAPDSEITVITVIPFEAIGASPDPIKPSDREWQWNCLVDATARLRRYGIDPYIEAAAGNPPVVIAETATAIGAELVVLGNGHGRRWQPTLKRKPVRASLQRQLSCDTLVVRSEAEAA
jgi:nucleotide-binding universal stress UspA family protein